MTNTTQITTISNITMYKQGSDTVSISDINPQNLQGLFGRVVSNENNITRVNIFNTIPTSCDPCLFGECLNPTFEQQDQKPFITSTDSLESSTSTKTQYCRRIVAMYLYKDEEDSTYTTILSDDDIKEMEHPCGKFLTCNALPFHGHKSVLVFRHNTIETSSLTINGIKCFVSQSQPDYSTYSVIRIIYSTRNCSDFESNSCLHENANSNSSIVLYGSEVTNIVRTKNEYVEQACCSTDYCIDDATTHNTGINLSVILGTLTPILVIILIFIVAVFCFKMDKTTITKIKEKINKLFGIKNSMKTEDIEQHEL